MRWYRNITGTSFGTEEDRGRQAFESEWEKRRAEFPRAIQRFMKFEGERISGEYASGRVD